MEEKNKTALEVGSLQRVCFYESFLSKISS